MKKSKKIAAAALSAALIATLAIGGTYAYLSSKTGVKNNTFTMGTGIEGHTDEPKWVEKEATNYTPGKVIAKDPVIVNSSVAGTDDAYVGLTITYQIKDANGNFVDTDYATLDQFINIESYDAAQKLVAGFNTTGWTLNTAKTLAYYNTKLAAQTTTTPVFDAVEIDKLALTPDQVASAAGTNVQFDISKYTVVDAAGKTTYNYTTYTMHDFQIVIEGYMVQEAGFAGPLVALQTAFPTTFGTFN